MLLATYGTLRLHQGNWAWILQESPHLGTFRVRGFKMYSNGAFPYAVPSTSEDHITVDVFEIGQQEFRQCDGLEGYPHHYNRKLVHIEELGRDAWIYFSERDVSHCLPVPSGDWLERPKAESFSL